MSNIDTIMLVFGLGFLGILLILATLLGIIVVGWLGLVGSILKVFKRGD